MYITSLKLLCNEYFHVAILKCYNVKIEAHSDKTQRCNN